MVPSYSRWSHPPSSSEHTIEPPAQDQKDKPKKPRHRHSAFQLAALNELYDKNEHPPLDERTSLAERLGMEVKTVNAWFQNKRASSKKRHKGPANPQYELPPISALLASVSSAPPPPPDFDELSEDEHLLSDRRLPRIPHSHSSQHTRDRQTSFYANNSHRHLFESEQAMPRKGRSRPSQAQTEELRKLYDVNPHPTKEEREELGDRIGMRYQSVTNWFQNQRSIAKKRKEEEDAHSSAVKPMDFDQSSSSSRTFSPFPPSSSVVHPSLSVPPATNHPSLTSRTSLAVSHRMRRSPSAAPTSSIIDDSRPSSPRASPYRVAAAERASSVTNGRPRRSRPEPYQLEALKKLFHRTPTPSIEERGALALEVNMDVGKVTNWFRNLRQTARKQSKKNDGDDDGYDDDISLATYNAYSRDVSRAGSPFPTASLSSHHDDSDTLMDEGMDSSYAESVNVKVEHPEKHHRLYSHIPLSHSHSDMGSEEDYQEAVTPSPESSPPPTTFAPVLPTHVQKRARQHAPAAYFSMDIPYAEMQKATAKFKTGVKVEDALLLLSFHHHVVR